MTQNSLKVLVVDSSAEARLALLVAIRNAVGIEVVAEATNGKEALRLINHYKPDIVTMEVTIGDESGAEITAKIMERTPVPVLFITNTDPNDPDLVFSTVQAGALDVCAKLPAKHDPSYEARCNRLVRLLKSLAKVPVVTKRKYGQARLAKNTVTINSKQNHTQPKGTTRLIVIGASTGGPQVLQKLLSALPAPFPLPIAIVQHISTSFTKTLANWLGHTTGHQFKIVSQAMKLEPGIVYLAAEDQHLQVVSNFMVRPSMSPDAGYHRPSVNELFVSAAKHGGKDTVAILLTGMGHDGVEGMIDLYHTGAQTIAQSPDSCVIDSMPLSAIDMGVVSDVLSPDEIIELLKKLGQA